MPYPRLTSEQLEDLVKKGGCKIIGGMEAVHGPTIQDDRQDSLPFVECDTGNGTLAKKESKEGNTGGVSGRTLIRYVVYRKRILDPDNVSLKGITDCLRYANILRGDEEARVRIEIADQVKVKTDEEERIEISVFAPDSVEAKQANQK